MSTASANATIRIQKKRASPFPLNIRLGPCIVVVAEKRVQTVLLYSEKVDSEKLIEKVCQNDLWYCTLLLEYCNSTLLSSAKEFIFFALH